MDITARGIKGLLIALVVIVGVIVILIVTFQLIILLLPIAVVIFLIGYFFKTFHKLKKDDLQQYKDIEFKIRKLP